MTPPSLRPPPSLPAAWIRLSLCFCHGLSVAVAVVCWTGWTGCPHISCQVHRAAPPSETLQTCLCFWFFRDSAADWKYSPDFSSLKVLFFFCFRSSEDLSFPIGLLYGKGTRFLIQSLLHFDCFLFRALPFLRTASCCRILRNSLENLHVHFSIHKQKNGSNELEYHSWKSHNHSTYIPVYLYIISIYLYLVHICVCIYIYVLDIST